MKKLFLVAFLVVGIATFAQNRKEERKEKFTPEQRIEMQTKRLTKELNLNENQAQQLRVAIAKRVETTETKENRRKKQNEFKAELKRILTAEQYAKWEQKLNERKEKIKEKRKNNPAEN